MSKDYGIIAVHPTGSDFYYRGIPTGLFADPDKVWVGALRWQEALEMTKEEAEAMRPILQEKLPTRTVEIVRFRNAE